MCGKVTRHHAIFWHKPRSRGKSLRWPGIASGASGNGVTRGSRWEADAAERRGRGCERTAAWTVRCMAWRVTRWLADVVASPELETGPSLPRKSCQRWLIPASPELETGPSLPRKSCQRWLIPASPKPATEPSLPRMSHRRCLMLASPKLATGPSLPRMSHRRWLIPASPKPVTWPSLPRMSGREPSILASGGEAGVRCAAWRGGMPGGKGCGPGSDSRGITRGRSPRRACR